MRQRLLLGVGLLATVACTPDSVPPGDTGELPAGAAPSYCEVASTVEVGDPSVAATGFDFAVQTVLDANLGDWGGTFAWAGTGSDYAAMSFVRTDAPITAVTQTLVDPGGTDSGLQAGAPTAECPPYYAIPVTLGFSLGDDLLDEAVAIELFAINASSPTFEVSIALDDLVGSLSPEAWSPADWVTNELSVYGYREDEIFIVSVAWLATNNTEARAVGKGEGESGGGTTTPSGMTEAVGTLRAGRL